MIRSFSRQREFDTLKEGLFENLRRTPDQSPPGNTQKQDKDSSRASADRGNLTISASLNTSVPSTGRRSFPPVEGYVEQSEISTPATTRTPGGAKTESKELHAKTPDG
jgi:hypothetical protein